MVFNIIHNFLLFAFAIIYQNITDLLFRMKENMNRFDNVAKDWGE